MYLLLPNRSNGRSVATWRSFITKEVSKHATLTTPVTCVGCIKKSSSKMIQARSRTRQGVSPNAASFWRERRMRRRDINKLLQTRIDEWLSIFNRAFQSTDCIVYMHHLCGHLSDRIAKFGDMDLFNIQGLEKLNDITTTQYFRGTNRKYDYMSQLMYKRVRIEGFILDSIRKPESQKAIEKKLARYEFFQYTDLYDITGILKKNIIEKLTYNGE